MYEPEHRLANLLHTRGIICIKITATFQCLQFCGFVAQHAYETPTIYEFRMKFYIVLLWSEIILPVFNLM